MKSENKYRNEFRRVYGDIDMGVSEQKVVDKVWEDRESDQDFESLAVKLENFGL